MGCTGLCPFARMSFPISGTEGAGWAGWGWLGWLDGVMDQDAQ